MFLVEFDPLLNPPTLPFVEISTNFFLLLLNPSLMWWPIFLWFLKMICTSTKYTCIIFWPCQQTKIKGIQAMKLLSRAENLMDYIGVQTEEVREKISDISTSFKKLKVVVDQCFGVKLFPGYTNMLLKSSVLAIDCCQTSHSL